MNYIKNNSTLLKKYSMIVIFNIIIYILTSFYFKVSDTGTLIMLIINFLSNLFIYNYKGCVEFKYYLDIIFNTIIGLLLMIFIKDEYNYVTVTLSLFLGNNIVFMRSRVSDKFFKRSLQYILILLITFLNLLINYLIFSI